MEDKMNGARNELKFKYTEVDGTSTDATPTVLRTKIRSSPDESVRKSCWEETRKARLGGLCLPRHSPSLILMFLVLCDTL
jgi:hypothetical protein